MKRTNILLVMTIIGWSACAVAADAIPAAKQKKPIALVGGTIHTVSGDVLQNATIVFDKGKITALGTLVAIPADAEQIDVRGKHIYPGIIDSYDHIGLTEIGSVTGNHRSCRNRLDQSERESGGCR